MFFDRDRLLDLPQPAEAPGSTAEKLRAIELQIAALVEERNRLRRLLGGDPFRLEERLSRLAKLAAHAQALAAERDRLSGTADVP
jgi:hypothetical protein